MRIVDYASQIKESAEELKRLENKEGSWRLHRRAATFADIKKRLDFVYD